MFAAARRIAATFPTAAALTALALTAAALTTALAPVAHADEQRVKRFGVALYVMPTSMGLHDFNNGIETLNQAIAPTGLAPLNNVHWSAQFGLEGRFMVTKRWVLTAGFGRIKKDSKLSLQPSSGTSLLFTGSVLTVPRNLGIDYYFPPKTSGNFTVRPFLGGGVLSLVETKGKLGGGATTGGVFTGAFLRPAGEGLGAYAEGGVHLMLPSKYSLLLNGYYRHAKLSQVVEETSLVRLRNPDGSPFTLDLSGIGIRFAAQIDFYGKPVK